MANTQAFPTSLKVELLNGSHALGAQAANGVRTVTTKDVIKAALFLASASLGAATTAYSATGEVSGTGYTAAGVTVTNATAPTSTSTTAHWTPSASFAWTTVTLSTAFDCVQLYNDSSTGKLTLTIHTFSSQTVTAGNFTLTMPANDASNGLIRLA
jgi:hypothetical protein